MCRLAAILLATLALAPPALAQRPQWAPGCWEGSLGSGETARRLILVVPARPSEASPGILHTYARTARTDTLRRVTFARDSVMFAAPDTGDARASFRGRLSDSGERLDGTVWRGGQSLTFSLRRGPDRATPDPRVVGYWLGTLDVRVAKLRLGADIAPGPCGLLVATLDSPDQGAMGIPTTKVTVDGDTLRIVIDPLGARFDGVIGEKTLTGNFIQLGNVLPLTLERQANKEAAAPPRRPQEPKPPFPYRTEDVTYENAAGGVRLAGTLALPEGKGPFPAALLLSGSGPQDRNENIFGHKPFLVIADYLARRGIATLRVDDRGVGGSTGDVMKATLEDNASDALAGIALLAARPEIDRKRIGLIGHSEGGWLAPIVATRSRDVAFLVLLAGPGVSGEALLEAQQAALLRASGAAERVKANQAISHAMFEALKTERDSARVAQRIDAALTQLRPTLSSPEQHYLDSLLQAQQKAGDPTLRMMLTPWFRYILTYDPARVLEQVKVPVLALFGELDLQVPPDQSVPALERAFRAGHNERVRIVRLPGLNHLFQHATTGLPDEYVRVEETFAPAALAVMGDWIGEQTRRGKK